LQGNPQVTVQISEANFPDVREVDLKLIELAKQLNARIITNDFNLNKVSELRGVEVLNINELANALKPVVLPGEIMKVFILKEGKEHNQGVAYLDDGTMVVVDNARRMIGKTVAASVTSVLQTTAGKMIFGRYVEETRSGKIRQIVVAAGTGQRLGAERPKQFLSLCGEPVLIHTLRAFESCRQVNQIILVLPEHDRTKFSTNLPAYGLKKIARIVHGGPERQDSVWNGLQVLDPAQTDIVLVHDGARPLVTSEEIAKVVSEAQQNGAATIGYPVTDTLKEVESGQIIKTVDRRRFYLVQTPQAFRVDILLNAYQRAFDGGLRATDDATLVEQSGVPVSVVEGSRENIKITWPDDLALAEFWLNRRRS
jgi:2-C-methyl-D-erythritol 4-phosphate cytidylyltransferase